MTIDINQLPIFDVAGVTVVGSGSAGAVAAIASARSGAEANDPRTTNSGNPDPAAG